MSSKYNEKIALEIIHKVGAKPELLVQILYALVVRFSYIDENAIRLIAKEVNLSLISCSPNTVGEVYG